MADLKLVATVEFKINFLKPSFINDELTGRGLVIKHGKRLYTVRGDIYNQDKQIHYNFIKLITEAIKYFNSDNNNELINYKIQKLT